MTTAWSRAADLLEQEPDGPDADLNREIVEAAQRLAWRDAAARLVGCLRELRPCPGEVAAARRAAGWLPSLRPRDWDSAPCGEALVEAVLEAYRRRPPHRRLPTPTQG